MEDAECECCGMSKECTTSYIVVVRYRFSRRWLCDLCVEAVAEEAGKNGIGRAGDVHGRVPAVQRLLWTHRVLFQADTIIDIMRKLSRDHGRQILALSRRSSAKVPICKSACRRGMALIAGVRNMIRW